MAAESGSWQVINDETDESVPAEEMPRSAPRWRRLVLRMRKVRFQQRLWGLLGGYLQSFPASLRDRLRTIFV